MMIAERQLTLDAGDDRRQIAVRLFAPQRLTTGDWSCRYTIDWPHGEREHAAHGLDAVQSLTLALQMIGAEIYTSPYHRDERLFWESQGQGYGFPLPKTLADLAVGDDLSEA